MSADERGQGPEAGLRMRGRSLSRWQEPFPGVRTFQHVSSRGLEVCSEVAVQRVAGSDTALHMQRVILILVFSPLDLAGGLLETALKVASLGAVSLPLPQ